MQVSSAVTPVVNPDSHRPGTAANGAPSSAAEVSANVPAADPAGQRVANPAAARRLASMPLDPAAAARHGPVIAPQPAAVNPAGGSATPVESANQPRSCTYSQSSGNLTCRNAQGQESVNHNGYSGRNVSGGTQGRNNPDAQHVSNTGPIPRGRYTIGAARNSANTGRAVRDLTPTPGNQMEGRGSFQIHGDNARGDASEGCIVMPRNVRDSLQNGDALEVVR
ncbi:MAG: DUF2778 domain-containing protein [Ottowia sp.]|nr:DUF2778 domain-containing protein [Ottowia sp.]